LDRDFLLMEASIAKGSTCYWTKQAALGSSGWWNSQERACTGNCIANADIEGGIGGAIAGGIAGAVGGSVLPGPGTVTGFIGGAVMGGFWGATTASATRAIFSIFGTK
jgi:hypothetical protein